MQKLIAFISTSALIVLGVMFSAVLLVFIVSAGLIVFGYFWWRTRALRKQMRAQRQAMSSAANDADAFNAEVCKGEIIEGEVISKIVSLEEIKR